MSHTNPRIALPIDFDGIRSRFSFSEKIALFLVTTIVAAFGTYFTVERQDRITERNQYIAAMMRMEAAINNLVKEAEETNRILRNRPKEK